MDVIGRINECESGIYLAQIGEPRDGVFGFQIQEAKICEKKMKLKSSSIEITDLQPITTGNDCFKVDVKFHNYVAYVVGNESFWTEEESKAPQIFEEIKNSVFATYVDQTTSIPNQQGPVRVWKVRALNHIISIASLSAPEFEVIGIGT